MILAHHTVAGNVTDAAAPPSSAAAAQLRVLVTVRAESPVDRNFYQEYETSPGFDVTDDLCSRLVGRIHHCARELITRSDSKATEPLRYTAPHTKLARYRLMFRIDRRGAPWREMHFTSFQEKTMTLQAAHEVVLETDRIVGLFLQSHDAAFHWALPCFVQQDPLGHKKTAPRIGAQQDAHCIPSYVDTPGYSIHLSLHTQGPGCPGHDWSVRVDSRQGTPLTLDRAEDLMSEVGEIMYEAVRAREDDFADMHEKCDALEGTHGCRHVQQGAFDLEAAVRNNYGPDFSHLSTRHRTFRLLINHSHADALVRILQQELETARHRCDAAINSSDELVLKVHEMRTEDWKLRRPLTVTLGPSNLHSRKTVERILERVVTGTTDVLSGHGIAAVVTIHKRGHLILDRTICSGEDSGPSDPTLSDSVDRKVQALRCRLGQRIRDDLTMVLKDTISLRTPLPLPDINVVTPSDWAANDDGLDRGNNYLHRILSKGDSSSCISTPSLADTGSIHHHEGVATPDSALRLPRNYDGIGVDVDGADPEDFHQSQDHVESASIGTVIRHAEPSLRAEVVLLPDQWSRAPSSEHLRGGKDPRLASEGSSFTFQSTETTRAPSDSIHPRSALAGPLREPQRQAYGDSRILLLGGSAQRNGALQGFVPRRACTSAEAAPTQSFVNASAVFDQRPRTSPAGSSPRPRGPSGDGNGLHSREILQNQLKRKKSNSIAGSRIHDAPAVARSATGRRYTLPATAMAFTGSFGHSRWALDSR
ncbi:hypothetical protein GMORB2_5720 [Geosmithia morbida]|uniref:Uncharacterized protein n=1 Tax=Geosmithia morbida TaxID=1094350 RepID=A0A9P4YZR0_9HYPO|nr:uncharacterized protein GMORB2_5720 [Geosmithia morbida]KAF4124004.1 hypothetical protein GMORB2_5720 [Geosmithia morbida]